MLEEKDGKLVQVRASGMSDLLMVVIQQFQHYCLEAIHLKLKYKENLTPEIISQECPEKTKKTPTLKFAFLTLFTTFKLVWKTNRVRYGNCKKASNKFS